MLRNFQYQLERDKWEKEQMMQKINELTNLVEAMARTSLGSSNNSDPASPRGSVYVPMDRRRISEYVGDQLDQMHGIIHKEDDETQLQRLIRERERRDLEIQQIQREYESRIQMLREEQARGQYRRPLTQMQPPQERQTLNRLQSGEGAYQPQQDTLLLERQFPNDDPAHYDMYYDSESEKDINCEDGRSSRGRSNSYRNGHIRGSNSNNNLINDNISMYSAGQLNSNNSNNSNMSYTNDQASIYSNGYSNTNNINYINDRASAYSDGIQNNFDNTNDRASTSSYGIQSNYINNNNERGNNASNGHPSPYSINSDPNSSYSSTIGPTTIYGSNSVSMYNGSPPFFGNTTHLGPYSTSPVNGYIHSANSNYGSGSGGLNSGYTSSSHRSNYEDEDQARFERRQSELEASYSEVMEMAQKK
ncbi:hypothetical protein K501DRAFT_63807 [Backusella circina FSU 941]|nr:hypothetical protein K501DRAFT_63807 [Backusella circina FSU 941]